MRDKGLIYHDIKQFLKDRIESGEWQTGERMPSENELVEQLNVGRHRVRPALRELELEGYITRRRGSGSYIAPASSRTATIKTADKNTVAMFLPRYTPGFPREVVNGFMQYMATAGRQIIVYNIETDESSETDSLRSVVDSGIGGLVAWIDHDSPANRKYLMSLTERRFPVVLVDRYLYGLEIDHVGSSNEEIGYRLTCALIELGHSRIAFGGYKRELSSATDRFNGYQRALGEAGLLSDGGRSSTRSGRGYYLDLDRTLARPGEQVAEIMALRDRPTAFVCLNDGFADRVGTQLARLGYSVPDDVELATVDDDHATDRRKPVRLHIQQQGYEVGSQSGEVLLARMATPDGPVQRRLIEAGPVYRTGMDQQPAEKQERRDNAPEFHNFSQV